MLQKYQSGSNRQAEELIDRGTALKAIHQNVKNENLIKHMLATEAIMRALRGIASIPILKKRSVNLTSRK